MPNGQTQQLSIEDFAKKIKSRRPELDKFDNVELVHKVIQRQPKLQRFLSTDALKDIAAGGRTTPAYGFDIGHEYEAAKGVLGGVGQFLETIFDPRIPVTGKHGMIDRLMAPQRAEWQKMQDLRKQSGMMNQLEASGHAAASVLPVIGPLAAEIGERIGRQDIGGALTESALYALMGNKVKDLDKKGLVEGYASVTKNPRLQALIHNSAYEDNFVNAKGLDIRDKVAKAQRTAQDEVNKHAQAVASVIDKRNPDGVINAAAEAQNLAQEFKNLVKTPAAQSPWLQKLLKHAPETHPGGLWTFEEARQFRSDVGDALRNSKGVGTAVLARVYHSLTEKLAQTAKDYGMEDSWNHYNKLKATMSQNFGEVLDDITSSKSGQEVAKALLKDKGLSSELVRNLSKYGLDPKDVLRFRKYASNALRSGVYRSVFRYIYGTPAGFAGYVGAKMAGLPWVPSFGIGAALGITTSKLLALARMARVDPAIMEEVFSKREMPGPRGVSEGRTPPGETILASPPGLGPSLGPTGQGPQEPHLPMPPGALGPAPSTLPEAKPEPQALETPKVRTKSPGTKAAKIEEQATSDRPEWTIEQYKSEISRVAEILRNPKATLEERDVARGQLKHYQEELGKLSGAKTTVAEGVHGRGRLAEQAKARERVNRVREVARRTRQKEIEEAAGAPVDRGAAMIQIPELEEALEEHSPDDLETLKGLRKKKRISDEQYIEGLKAFLLMALDKKGE